MSLVKQLWIAVIAAMTLVFGGSLLVSVLSARDYLEQQLQVKNIDNATSLALSLSQLPKDVVTVELQVAAQFDAGHYQFIRIVSPTGQILVERVYSGPADPTPRWFTRLVPIHAAPGQAQIQDGWKQYGTLSLESHEQYAYQSLWKGTLQLLLWFAWAGTLVGVIGAITLRRIISPLDKVVGQAQAIAERRFVRVDEPRTPELRSVVRAMNGMAQRLQAIFSEESERLNAVRQKVNLDALTGLSTRDHFLSHLHELLTGDVFGNRGTLVLLRLQNLQALNIRLGHERVDALIRELGQVFQDSCLRHVGRQAGRIQGNEFAIVCPTVDDPAQAAAELHQHLCADWLPRWTAEAPDLFHMAAVPYRRQQDMADLQSRAEEALARAESQGANSWDASEADGDRTSHSADQWRDLLSQAVAGNQLQLAFYRVVSCHHRADLHHEGVLRLRLEDGRALLESREFMPMAEQLGLASEIGLRAVRLAFQHLRSSEGSIAINLSAEAIADFHFRREFTQLLEAHPELCPRLLLEVTEYGVFRQIDAFHDLVHTVKPLGCRVGIGYLGPRFAEGPKLASLGLDYIKVHPSYVHGLAQTPGNQEFLKGLCTVARQFGIVVIALGVASDSELPLLASLGFDGATRAGMA